MMSYVNLIYYVTGPLKPINMRHTIYKEALQYFLSSTFLPSDLVGSTMRKTRVLSGPVVTEKKWTKQEKLRGPIFTSHTTSQKLGARSPSKKRPLPLDMNNDNDIPMPPDPDFTIDGSNSKRKRKGTVSHHFEF